MNKQELEEVENNARLAVASFAPSDLARETLMDGFREAYAIYVQWLDYHHSSYSLGQKGFNEELDKLHKALVKLRNGRGTKEAAINSIESAIHFIPQTYLQSFDTYLPDHSPSDKAGMFLRYVKALSEPDCNQQELITKLTIAVESILGNLSTPGRGKRKFKAVQYIEPLERLKIYFQEAMPGYSLSAKKGSTLQEYMRIWLHNYAKTETDDVSRIIEQLTTR